MNTKPISITFDQNYSTKIKVIQESISDPCTYQKVLEGLVDSGYANALKTLYADRRISADTYQYGINRLPDYLRSHIDS